MFDDGYRSYGFDGFSWAERLGLNGGGGGLGGVKTARGGGITEVAKGGGTGKGRGGEGGAIRGGIPCA